MRPSFENKDYYTILGLPPTASQEMIRRRYRQLVRRLHPDVNPGNPQAHQLFLEIQEAYQVLADPARRKAYDTHRQEWLKRVAGFGTTETPQGRKEFSTTAPRERIPLLLEEARRAFYRKDYPTARRLCRQILSVNPHNSEAYLLLGDIASIENKRDLAIAMYTYAQQFDPNNPEPLRKLDRLLEEERKRVDQILLRESVLARAPLFLLALDVLLILVLYLMSLKPPQSQREVIQSFLWFQGIPRRVLWLLLGDAFLMALFLSGLGGIKRFDDEMVFSSRFDQAGGGSVPIGLFVPLLALLSLYLAFFVYLIIAFLQERFSLSVVFAFVSVLLLTFLFALPHPTLMKPMLLWASGLAFSSFCLGWMVADSFRPYW